MNHARATVVDPVISLVGKLSSAGSWTLWWFLFGVGHHADSYRVAHAMSARAELRMEVEYPLLHLIGLMLQVQRLDVELGGLLLGLWEVLQMRRWLWGREFVCHGLFL